MMKNQCLASHRRRLITSRDADEGSGLEVLAVSIGPTENKSHTVNLQN